jgi:hypothetical protein
MSVLTDLKNRGVRDVFFLVRRADAGGVSPFLGCPTGTGYAQLLSSKGLAPLLGYLRRLGAAPEAPAPASSARTCR